jgi:hypothetical protein
LTGVDISDVSVIHRLEIKQAEEVSVFCRVEVIRAADVAGYWGEGQKHGVEISNASGVPAARWEFPAA